MFGKNSNKAKNLLIFLINNSTIEQLIKQSSFIINQYHWGIAKW